MLLDLNDSNVPQNHASVVINLKQRMTVVYSGARNNSTAADFIQLL